MLRIMYPMRILYVSGGSAGHLAPLIAVERAVMAQNPDAESLFLCTDKPEDAAYLRHERVTFKQLPLPRRSWKFPLQFLRNEAMSRLIMQEFKPDVVFSKGGAVSVPACRAAKKLGIPIVLHESDAVMGRANRIVAKWAKVVCLGFPMQAMGYGLWANDKKGSQPKDHSPKLILTGNPVRPHITEGSREEGLRITGLSGKRPILLVWGGSQGAEAINEAIRTNVDALLAHCDIVHLTGKGKNPAPPRAGYWSAEFVHTELPHLFAITSFALSRAGAGTISELAANGIPAILVPIEGLANDHQVKNARIAAEHGGCLLLQQKDLVSNLVSEVDRLSNDPETLRKMSQKIRTFQQPDASRRIAEILFQCIAPGPTSH